MRKHGSFWQAAAIFTFLSIFVWTTFALAASLHLRTTTDKDAYNVNDEVNWTIWAWASESDNYGVYSCNVYLNDNQNEELNPAITVGVDPNEELLDTEYGLVQGFNVSSAGTPNLNAPRLREIRVLQYEKICNIGNDGTEHVFAKGTYTTTKLGPHNLNVFLGPSYYWVNDTPGDYEAEEFDLGDNFPAQFNVVFDADVDGDMYINLGDLGQLGGGWLVTDCNTINDWCGRADIDRSGEVDPNDISFMGGQWLWCSNPDDPDCDQYLPE